MSDAITALLSQIRHYQPGFAAHGLESPRRVDALSIRPPGDKVIGFSETLQNTLQGVNQTQKTAGLLAQSFELGDPRADLARVMVAAQQSQVEFRATVEVRNRLVQAYQDVMNMPL